MSPSEKYPTEDSVVSKNDDVGFEGDHTYETDLKQWGDSEVNATMGDGMNPTEHNGVSNNHHLGYNEHGRLSS